MSALGSVYEPLPQDPGPAESRPAVALKRAVKRRMLGASIAVVSLVALFAQQYSAQVETLAASLVSAYGSSCPDPTRLRPPPSTQLSRSIDLPSSRSPFSVAVNYDPDACNAFEVSVTRRDSSVCARTSTIIPSKDEELARYIKTSLGPDTLEIRLDGAERVAQQIPTRFDADACSYHYSFRLINSGRVYLNITHLFVDYRGFREDRPDVVDPFPGPPLVYRVLDSETPVPLDLCPMCHAPSPSTRSTLQALPLCDNRSTPPGGYIPSPLILEHTLHPVEYRLPVIAGRPLAGLLDWVPQGCRWDHAGLEGRDHAPCLAQKHRMLVIGDSHTRVLSEATLHRLEGREGMLLATVPAPSRTSVVGGLTIDFVYDQYMLNTTYTQCDVLSQYDSVVVSTGTHTLAWKCETTNQFASTLERTMTALAGCKEEAAALRPGQPSPRHIFLTIPPIQNHLGRATGCRTQPRIARWNAEARQLAAKLGWDVLDFYQMAAPLQMEAKLVDGTHYLKTDAMAPLVDNFLGMLGICDQGN
ncbi:hypothetical protein JCM10049v2_007304 [Rhodotorula toruloides]